MPWIVGFIWFLINNLDWFDKKIDIQKTKKINLILKTFFSNVSMFVNF